MAEDLSTLIGTNGCYWPVFAALPAIPARSIPGSAQRHIQLSVTADVLHETIWFKGHPECGVYWSRLMSSTDSSCAFLDEGFIFGGSTQDNNHLDHEYSLSSYDIPQNLSIGYGVDLPFGRRGSATRLQKH